MNRSFIIIMAGVSVLLLGRSGVVSGQSRGLEKRLEATTRIECNFSTLATGNWDDDTTSVAVTPAEFELSFFDIDVDEGTAEADSRFGASYIVVRYSFGYLHLMQILDSGPLRVTTVLAQETADGRLKAIHTRHEYSPTILPGFTSRPEMYIGDCAIDE